MNNFSLFTQIDVIPLPFCYSLKQLFLNYLTTLHLSKLWQTPRYNEMSCFSLPSALLMKSWLVFNLKLPLLLLLLLFLVLNFHTEHKMGQVFKDIFHIQMQKHTSYEHRWKPVFSYHNTVKQFLQRLHQRDGWISMWKRILEIPCTNPNANKTHDNLYSLRL